MHGGRGCGRGVPLPHQETFAFLEFKISDLVHTFGEFLKYCLLSTQPGAEYILVRIYFYRVGVGAGREDTCKTSRTLFCALQSTEGVWPPCAPPPLASTVTIHLNQKGAPIFISFFFFSFIRFLQHFFHIAEQLKQSKNHAQRIDNSRLHVVGKVNTLCFALSYYKLNSTLFSLAYA